MAARLITFYCDECSQGCKLKLITVDAPGWGPEFCCITGDKKVHWKELIHKPKPKHTQSKLQCRETEV